MTIDYYAFATKDIDADCNNYAGLGEAGKKLCIAGKGAKKQITGEGTALDPKLLAAQDKAKMEANLSSGDKDCANYGGLGGLLDGLCVAGKSVTKGFGGLQGFFQNPMTLLAVGVAVVIIILILTRR